jgi:hypothetical protein
MEYWPGGPFHPGRPAGIPVFNTILKPKKSPQFIVRRNE